MFIVLEGIDGCGKTTQADRLMIWLEERFPNQGVLRTCEPGGWPGGAEVREFILGGNFASNWSEFFLFMMDRCEHVARVIAPAARSGSIVISDRYTPSTLAYQILGDPHLPRETAAYILQLPGRVGLPDPDVVFLFDIDVETAAARLDTRTKRDAFDARGPEYFERVRKGYDILMNGASGGRWIKIDARGSEDEVFEALTAHMESILAETQTAHCSERVSGCR